MDRALKAALADHASLWDEQLEEVINTSRGESLVNALEGYNLEESMRHMHSIVWHDEIKCYQRAYERRKQSSQGDLTIKSLHGIEEYTGLRMLDLRESNVADLVPLTRLPKLEVVRIGVDPKTDLVPLLQCNHLLRVDIVGKVEDDQPLKALQKRKVIVDPLEPSYADESPFGCWQLKLAVLQELSNLKAIKLPQSVYIDEYRLDEVLLGRLTHLPISEKNLGKIKRLYWRGGGLRIQHHVWSQWDGESEEFDIESLAGLENLPNLKEIDIWPLEQIAEEEITVLRQRGITINTDG